MAVFRSNTYDGRYLQLDISQNGENIDWTLSSIGGSSSRYTICNAYVEIDGQAVYGKNEQYILGGVEGGQHYYPYFPVKKGSTSGSVKIGSSAKQINVVFRGSVYKNFNTNYGGTFSFAATSVLSYYLDVNGFLDGAGYPSLAGYGNFDLYINGSLHRTGIDDCWEMLPYGTTYEIKNIQATNGHSYNGVYSGSLSGTITDTTSVYLNFTSNTYTVTYDANGGSCVIQSQPFAYGGGSIISDIPIKTGHIFLNWKASHGEYYLNPGDAIPQGWGNFTLIAQWMPCSYNITFDHNGGVLQKPGNNIYNSDNSQNIVSVTYGTTMYWDMGGDIPTRDGFKFKGWYDSRVGGIQVYNSGGMAIGDGRYYRNDNTEDTSHLYTWIYPGDATLYAQWEPNTFAFVKDEEVWKPAVLWAKASGIWKKVLAVSKRD